jgi:hypothetical protein
VPLQQPAGPQVQRPARAPAQRRSSTLGARALAFLRGLPDHQLLDRAVRGRAWIPLLGVLLAGIVAMQVEVLKLGASIGRSIEAASTLETGNQQLRATVAWLADDNRIEAVAASMGMVTVPPGAIGFLSARTPGLARTAAANIHSPNPSAFDSSLGMNGAVVVANGMTAASQAASNQAAGNGSPVQQAPTAAPSSTAASSPQTAAAPAASTSSSTAGG